MTFKKFIILMLLAFSLFPAQKILAQTAKTQTNPAESSSSVSDIKNVLGKIPDFITKPIKAAINKMEEFRKNALALGELKNNEIKKETEELEKNGGNEDSPKNSLLKIFKYAELFLLSVFSLIFSSKIAFYSVFAIVVIFIFRFIWKKIFK